MFPEYSFYRILYKSVRQFFTFYVDRNMLIKIVGAILILFTICCVTYGSYKNSMVFAGTDPRLRGYPYVGSEGFKTSNKELIEYIPNGPSPAELYNQQPYHLLNDYLEQPRVKESVSCVNSRSCYATDFDQSIAKTGSFRQLTNNYKREFPDSCSAPFQELVLNFYKVKEF
jgi:hypothetical protein